MRVAVEVPDFPPVWAAAEAWELSWVSSDESGDAVRAMPGRTVTLDLPRGKDAAIRCAAVFGRIRTLPYGAAWPQGLSGDGVLRPSAAGGYAAALAETLLRAGCGRCPIDLPRFADEAESRLGDPWDVDPVMLAPAVAGRGFRVDYLRAPARASAVVSGLPAPLAPDSPWGAPAVPDGTGTAVVELAVGRVRRWMGGGYELAALASPEFGAVWTLSGPSGDQSGTRMTKVLPAPSLLDTDASPPWASAMCRTMASPSPVPPSSLERARSTR